MPGLATEEFVNGQWVPGTVPTPPPPLPPVQHITVTAGETILSGMAVRVANDGTLRLARADAYANVKGFVGLAVASALATFSCETAADTVTLTDWTAVIGAALLAPGGVYFLDPAAAGHLTTVVPTISGQLAVAVGSAASTTTMTLLPFSIIQL